MAADTRDLGIEQRDPRVEFVQRIALQAFAGEEAGSAEVPLGRPQPRSIIIVHCDAASDWNGALSMGWWGGGDRDVGKRNLRGHPVMASFAPIPAV
jgi:hypothetical protein